MSLPASPTNNHKSDDASSLKQEHSLHPVDVKLPLGSGGTSMLTHVKYNNQLCVLKVLKSYSTSDTIIENEYKILSQLAHSNIIRAVAKVSVTMTQDQATKARTGICLEYMDRGDLFDVLTIGIDWSEKLSILQAITNGLIYLHGLKVPIVHQDIKPENIFISTSPINGSTVKIGDFGVAMEVASDSKLLCPMGVGTERYMAPEYITNGYVTTKSDIYSLGGIIYCMLYGHEPWPDTSKTIRNKMVSRGVFPVSKYRVIGGAPQGLLQLCQKCFARDAQDRPSAEELHLALSKMS